MNNTTGPLKPLYFFHLCPVFFSFPLFFFFGKINDCIQNSESIPLDNDIRHLVYIFKNSLSSRFLNGLCKPSASSFPILSITQDLYVKCWVTVKIFISKDDELRDPSADLRIRTCGIEYLHELLMSEIFISLYFTTKEKKNTIINRS